MGKKERKVQRGNQCNLHASKLQTDNEQGASRSRERLREREKDRKLVKEWNAESSCVGVSFSFSFHLFSWGSVIKFANT